MTALAPTGSAISKRRAPAPATSRSGSLASAVPAQRLNAVGRAGRASLTSLTCSLATSAIFSAVWQRATAPVPAHGHSVDRTTSTKLTSHYVRHTTAQHGASLSQSMSGARLATARALTVEEFARSAVARATSADRKRLKSRFRRECAKARAFASQARAALAQPVDHQAICICVST